MGVCGTFVKVCVENLCKGVCGTFVMVCVEPL